MQQNPRTRVPAEPKIKVYTALLTQTSTNAPVATVLQNTLGGTITWTRVDTGRYRGTINISGGLPQNKRTLEFGNSSVLAILSMGNYTNDEEIDIYVVNAQSTYADNQLTLTPITIKIYEL